MWAFLSALTVPGKLTAIAALFLLAACGGQAAQAGEQPTRICADRPAAPDEAEPEGGAILDLSFGDEPAAPVDKAFWLSWTANGGGRYWVPDWYGHHNISGLPRCVAGPSNWTANCVIPRDRVVVFSIDMSACDAQSQQYGGYQYSAEIMNAFADWYDFMETEVGWDIRTGSTGSRTFFGCSNNFGVQTGSELGLTWPSPGSSCQDLPGMPKDLCFQSANSHLVQINLSNILAHVNQSFHQEYEKLTFIYNVVWHELMHEVGIGHVSDSSRLMNPWAPDGFYGYFHYPATEEIFALRNFNPQHTIRCDWWPPDVVGNSCPGETP